jgi:hypothetical protein
VDKQAMPADITADYQMSIRDQVVRVRATAVTGDIVLTLPPVADAAGLFFSIICREASATNTVTVEDHNDDSECWAGDLTFNGACDRALLYSDGMSWLVNSALTFADTTTPPTTAAPRGTTTAAPTTTAGPTTTAAPTTAGPTTTMGPTTTQGA